MKELKSSSVAFWNEGFEPMALGIGTGMIYIESLFTPGDDAEYVRRAIDEILAKPLGETV